MLRGMPVPFRSPGKRQITICGLMVTLLFPVPGCGSEEELIISAPDPAAASQTSEPSTATPPTELMPIDLVIPRAAFIPTPVEITAPTTAVKNVPREPLMAPAAATNLALNQPVTSSESLPLIGDLDYITDGEKESGDGNYVELGHGPQWVQLDLGQRARLYGIVIWRYNHDTRIYRNIIVQIADNAEMTENVQTVFNNDQQNALGFGAGEDIEFYETHEGQQIQLNGETARFIRLYSNGNTSDDQNHYLEVEVYGLPAKP